MPSVLLIAVTVIHDYHNITDLSAPECAPFTLKSHKSNTSFASTWAIKGDIKHSCKLRHDH